MQHTHSIAPMLATFATLAMAPPQVPWAPASANAQCTWQPLGAGFNEGERAADVKALAVHNDQLIAAGGFINSGGEPVQAIASWNGSIWQEVGGGLGGLSGVWALTSFNGDLIAAGYDLAGDSVFRWDGTQWQTLTNGPQGTVLVLSVYNGDLIAAGIFTQAGGATVNNVARWDGTNWLPLAGGINDMFSGAMLYALTVYDGDLIAAGSFLQGSGAIGNNIARWDGISWHPLGSGLEDSLNLGVNALEVYNGELIVGGDFNLAGGLAAHNLARWNGSSWNDLDNPPTDGRVHSLEVFNAELIAGKNNTEGGTLNMIDRWDGTTWSALEPNFTDTSTIQTLTVYEGALIAGGGFFGLAGGETANGVASWCAAPPCPADITGNGAINVEDLLALIGAWGTCADPQDCPADITGDGNVNVADLLGVIGAWGPCP